MTVLAKFMFEIVPMSLQNGLLKSCSVQFLSVVFLVGNWI